MGCVGQSIATCNSPHSRNKLFLSFSWVAITEFGQLITAIKYTGLYKNCWDILILWIEKSNDVWMLGKWFFFELIMNIIRRHILCVLLGCVINNWNVTFICNFFSWENTTCKVDERMFYLSSQYFKFCIYNRAFVTRLWAVPIKSQFDKSGAYSWVSV